MTSNMATTTQPCWHLIDNVDEIAWIKCAGYSYCCLIAEKIFFFLYSQVWLTIVFFCFFFFFLFSIIKMRKICCHPSVQMYHNTIRLSAYTVFNSFLGFIFVEWFFFSCLRLVVLSAAPPSWCCYAIGPIWVHKRSDIDAWAVRYGFRNTSSNGPGN